jgi:ABC-type glycerol-3-phosphate transport system substrate-binding protein
MRTTRSTTNRAAVLAALSAGLMALTACSSSSGSAASAPTTSAAATSAATSAPASAAAPASAGDATSAPASVTSAPATSAAAPPSAGGAKVTLEMSSWSGAPGKDALERAIKSYEALHPNITIVDNEVSSDDFKAKIPLELNSGQAIDVLAVQPNLFASQIQSKLLPETAWTGFDQSSLSKFSAQTLAQNKKLFTDGQLYSIPMALSGSAVGYYNVDLLNKLGVQPPQTWADVAKLATLLKAKDPGVTPVVMPSGSDSWFLDEFVLTLVGQSDPTFFNDVRYNKGKWDTPSYVSALTAYQGLFKSGAIDKSTTDLAYANAMSTFFSGKAAMVFSGSWESTMLSEAYRKANKINIANIGVLPVPALTDPSQRSLRSFLDVTLGIPKASKHVAEAAAFIQYLSTGAGVNDWASTLGEIPALTGWAPAAGVLGTPEEQAGFTEIEKLIANPHSDRNNLSAFSGDVGNKILTVINGADPAKVAKQMQSDLDSGKYS